MIKLLVNAGGKKAGSVVDPAELGEDFARELIAAGQAQAVNASTSTGQALRGALNALGALLKTAVDNQLAAIAAMKDEDLAILDAADLHRVDRDAIDRAHSDVEAALESHRLALETEATGAGDNPPPAAEPSGSAGGASAPPADPSAPVQPTGATAGKGKGKRTQG